MARCLELAQQGKNSVAPNPMVGAVLVHEGIIIGEGYHQKYGQAHAEVNCINSVHENNRPLIEESTLYVSLEPCAHFGKTPPCADLIIRHKIPSVVIACRDAFAKVNGLGIEKLKAAGINVTEGILETEALELNKRFFCFHKNKRPYIILKWAQTADGFIAGKNFEAIAISNEFSNRWVHKKRAGVMAIMIGSNTALHDKPSLTTRKWPGKNPLRIFIDKQLKIDANAALLTNDSQVIVINEKAEKQQEHIHLFKPDPEKKMLPQLMDLLFRKNITSLLVEGGSILVQSFIDAGLWDEAFIINNQSLYLKEGITAAVLPKENIYTNSFTITTDRVDHYKNMTGTNN